MDKDKQGMDMLWNNFKWSNTHAIGIPEKRRGGSKERRYLKK